MSFQPKDTNKEANVPKRHIANHGMRPRQMGRAMGRNMNGASTQNQQTSPSGNLDKAVQAKMENAFQEDFSDVKVTQNSSEAANMGALAYTQGNEVHFAPGQYNPHTSSGQELIGHELTHVVQQKQGRVKATTQAKGASVNDDPALEKEADAMGKQAASGQEAVVQKKSEEGVVQKQGDPKKEDIVYTSGFTEKTISGVEVKGEYYNVVKGADGKYYKRNVAKIIRTSKSNWKEILENANTSYYMYHQWIFGFLKANTKGLYQFDFVPNQAVISAPNSGPLYCTLYDQSPYNDQDKLNFLEALYGIDEVESKVNLPNGYNMEGGISAERTFFPMMAEFVAKNQPLLIKSVSSRSKGSRMDKVSSNVTHLADEATPQGVFEVGKPDVAIAMIQSAYGSALASAKSLINLSINGLDNSEFGKALDESDIIYNSGLIINSTIKAYTGIVDKINKNRETAFDVAWSAIPFSKKIPDPAKDILKLGAKETFTTLFNAKHTSVSGMKNQMKSKFGDLKEHLEKAVRIMSKQGLYVDYDKISLRFDSMKNTFDSGLDD